MTQEKIKDSNPSKPLTQREIEVMSLIAQGKNTLEIASLLNVSPETIRTRIKIVCKKLGGKNKTHAVVLAMQKNLLSIKIHPNWGY